MLLGGPYEFARKAGDDLYPEQAKALAKAFDFMRYDFGCLTEFEAGFLEDAEVAPPSGWVVLDQARIVSLDTGEGHSVGLVLFPVLPDNSQSAPKDMVRKVERLIKEAREEYDLVVGISPWGLWAEKAWLDATDAGPDILLGAGMGMELQGTLKADGNTLWVRALAKGKSVNRVDLLAWPDRTGRPWGDDGEAVSRGVRHLAQHRARAPRNA